MQYLWSAYFKDGSVLNQPDDDRYSKHDDTKEWNPSAFRDIQEYQFPVEAFTLFNVDTDEFIGVDLVNGNFFTESMTFSQEKEPLENRKLIYFRDVETKFMSDGRVERNILRYAIGYEGTNSNGKVEKKVLYING